jgi:hypothetical protein
MSAIELLNAKRATPETLLEVMVTSIGELSGDLTEAQMRNAILTAGVSEAEFSRLRLELEHAPMLVGEAALAWISSMSHDPDVAEAIESAINDADRNAVLFETTALTIVALYGMYLLATRGATEKAHPVVPGSPICGMRMPCGGRLRRAREGIERLRAISVSTVPRGPKGRRTATGMPTSGSRHPKTGNPAPFQISPATPIC